MKKSVCGIQNESRTLMDNVRMPVTEVERITGLQRSTLYKLMDLGAADLGAIIPGERKTYVFFRPKVERFVQGGCDISQYTELIGAIKMMNFLLTNAILSLPKGIDILRNVEDEIQNFS